VVSVTSTRNWSRTLRNHRSILPRPWGRKGAECTSDTPSFAHARNSQASTNALPLYIDPGWDTAGGQRWFECGGQAHGVFGEAEPVAGRQPGVTVKEGADSVEFESLFECSYLPW
jgi:hypothetical protein